MMKKQINIGINGTSGSGLISNFVIVPASMGTISRIAIGNSGTLIERLADIVLKEKKKLIVVPRETPLNIIHLKNFLYLAEAGAIILPAMPGFYHSPKNIDDIINFIVGKF